MTELILIRHAESEGNVGISEHPDCAARLGAWNRRGSLQPGSRRWTSEAFCASPARIAGHEKRPDILPTPQISPSHIEERIREWGDAATIDGREYPRETPAHLIARLKDFLQIYAGKKVLAVSHASPIALLTQLAWGEVPRPQGAFWSGVDNCCLRWLRTTHELCPIVNR